MFKRSLLSLVDRRLPTTAGSTHIQGAQQTVLSIFSLGLLLFSVASSLAFLMPQRATAIYINTQDIFSFADKTTIYELMDPASGGGSAQQIKFVDETPNDGQLVYTYRDACGASTITITDMDYSNTSALGLAVSSGEPANCEGIEAGTIEIKDKAKFNTTPGTGTNPVPQRPNPYQGWEFSWLDGGNIIGVDPETGDAAYFTRPDTTGALSNSDSPCSPKDNIDKISADYKSATLQYATNSTGVCFASTVQVTLADPDNHKLAVGSYKSGQDRPSCDSGGNPLSWAICAIINGTAGLADMVFESFIIPNLQTNPISFEKDSPIYAIWNNFRIIANLGLVAVLFVIVFSQATKGPSIDAYTIKKIMPRLLLVAVLINISIYLVSILLDLTNIIGAGLRNLIVGPVAAIPGMMEIEPGGWFQALGWGALVSSIFAVIAVYQAGALMAVFQYALLFIIIPAVLALIGVLVMLILRQGVILFLVVISPIAFVLYCLPNTEQYFKRWWDTLFQMLLVYPIVIVFISIGSVLSAIFTRGT